jgi:autotransporter-associated beta strand protein
MPFSAIPFRNGAAKQISWFEGMAMNRRAARGALLKYATFGAVAFAPIVAEAGDVPTTPPVNFTNSSDPKVGSTIVNLVDSYSWLMVNNPAGMTQNIQTVITLTQGRTAAQTLAAIHDDRTAQPYSVLNGLGALTSNFMTGIGSSTTGTAPTRLTPTSYVTTTLQDYAPGAKGINYLHDATIGFANFGDGSATPLASAATFLNTTIRANASTEPPKRTFERFMGTTSPVTNPAFITAGIISPLDARYGAYNAVTKPNGLTPSDTAKFVVPNYFGNFTVPAVYGNTTNWVQGFTLTQAMVDANGGKPLTAPNLGTYDAAGNFTPYAFGVGAYVPGIGTAPRPYRLSADVNVPTQLYQIINNTNPYADGAFVSGHTNLAYNQALGLAFLVPQQYRQLLFRASDLGNNRILAGMHSPLDVIGGRIEATAIAATNIYNALYDANGNRVDWANPSNSAAYAVYQAYNQTQSYLAQACGAASVQACILQAQQSAAASDPYAPSAENQALYTARLTYGFSHIGPTNLPEVVPVQAQVLLLTRFPYLTDQQRTDVLRTTALTSGYPLLDGNTWDGWGRLNLYAAANGYGAFDGAVSVTMDAAQGGYNAFDIWSNNIGGAGSLTKDGSGALVLAGNNTYSGGTTVAGGSLIVAGSIAGPVNVAAGGMLSGVGTVGSLTVSGALAPGLPSIAGLTGQIGALTVAGNLQLNAKSNYLIQLTPASASSTVVNGAATIAGAMTASFAPGLYAVGSRLPALATANGLAGAFSSLSYSSAGPINVRPGLAYDGHSAFLVLNQAMLPALSAGGTGNAARVWGALNGFIAMGERFQRRSRASTSKRLPRSRPR